jgi:hypothetical protein
VDPLKKDPSEVPVKDTVWGLLARARYNNAYCNGAPPPKEVLDQLKSPKLLKNSTIRFVLDKDTSKTATAKTDGRGVLRVMLDTGLWWCCLTRDADPATGINKNCPLLFRKRFCSVRIQKNESNVAELMFQLPCDPCDPEVKRRP